MLIRVQVIILGLNFIDNGSGIEKKYLTSIFDLFSTANNQAKTNEPGVGLAIIKKIINSYGGEIGCLSEIKKGSTFWFTWPKSI